MLAVMAVIVIVAAAVLVWPTQAEEVNEPVDDGPVQTIAWCKFDAYFTGTGPASGSTVDASAFSFEEVKVSKGRYVGDGTDVPTQSLLSTLSLKWGNYDWRIDFHLTGPGDTDLEDSVEVNHDLPESQTTTISDGSGIFYVTALGTYTVEVELWVLRYGLEEKNEPVLATGSTTFTIPAEWATG